MKRITWVAGSVVLLLVLGQAVRAGATGGPRFNAERVPAYAADRYQVFFEGQEGAVIVVKGDGGTRLHLTVHDENGNLIAEDVGTTCTVRWTPKWTGRFVIKVHSLGGVENAYTLLTN